MDTNRIESAILQIRTKKQQITGYYLFVGKYKELLIPHKDVQDAFTESIANLKAEIQELENHIKNEAQ